MQSDLKMGEVVNVIYSYICHHDTGWLTLVQGTTLKDVPLSYTQSWQENW